MLNREMSKKLIFNKYKIRSLLNSSSFGPVYKGIRVKDNTPVAIKFEKRKSKYNMLESEAFYLMNLKGYGIPNILSFGICGLYNILVEEMLGLSLSNIFIFKKFRKFNLKDICMIGLQCLDRLEFIHSKLVIHRDIKPSNFVVGREDPEVIYLIDFGLSKKYKSSRTGKHIQFKNLKLMCGSMKYMSINANKGLEQSRRDDLESLGYMLVFLAKGFIPWEKAEKIKETRKKYFTALKIKKSLTSEQLCKGLPEEMAKYIDYCKELYFEQDPDYNYLRFLFITMLMKMKQNNDLKFCWISNKLFKNIINKKRKISENKYTKRSISPHIRLLNKIENNLRNYNSSINIHDFNKKDSIPNLDIPLNMIYKDSNNNKEKHNLSGNLEMKLKYKSESHLGGESTKEKDLITSNIDKSTSASDEKKVKKKNNKENEKDLNNNNTIQNNKYIPKNPEVSNKENKNKFKDLNCQDIHIEEMNKINNYDADIDLVQLNDDNNNKDVNINNKSIVLNNKNNFENNNNSINTDRKIHKNMPIKNKLISNNIFWNDDTGDFIEESSFFSTGNPLCLNQLNLLKYNLNKDLINNKMNLTNENQNKNINCREINSIDIKNKNIYEKNKKVFIYKDLNSKMDFIQKSMEFQRNSYFYFKNKKYLNSKINLNINKENINESEIIKKNNCEKFSFNNDSPNKIQINFFNKKGIYFSPNNSKILNTTNYSINKTNILANSKSTIDITQNLNRNKNIINEYIFDKNKEKKILYNIKNINQKSKTKIYKKLNMNIILNNNNNCN